MIQRSILFFLLGCVCLAACEDDDDSGDDDGASAPDDDGGNGDDGDDDGNGDDDGEAVDNRKACEDLVDDLECADIDIGSMLACDAFNEYDCDLAEYFSCFAEAWSCDPAELDPNALAACAELLTC